MYNSQKPSTKLKLEERYCIIIFTSKRYEDLIKSPPPRMELNTGLFSGFSDILFYLRPFVNLVPRSYSCVGNVCLAVGGLSTRLSFIYFTYDG